MDTVLLKTFLAVARQRHFGRAADQLCISQSAVSARVKQLEDSLGVLLFERRRNDIRLTPAGLRLERRADALLQGWERALQEVALPDELDTVLAIGFPVDLWPTLVCDGVATLLTERPALALRLNALPAETALEQLLSGALDVALLFDAPQLPGLHLRELARIPLVLASSHPADSTPRARDPDYIYVDWGSAFAASHAQAHRQRVPRVQCNVGLVAHDLIERLGGTAYLPRQTLPGDGVPAQVRDAPLIERTVHALFRADHPQPELIAALCDACSAAAMQTARPLA